MRKSQRIGFTLIEVLVVVAIIALLVSILLPSLKRARDQAKSAACAAQLSQLTRAENTYEAQYKNWIPGSEITTGYWFRMKKEAGISLTEWAPGVDSQPLLANNYDYFTPLRVEMYGYKSIPKDLYQLYRLGTEEVFHCPCNPHIAVNDLSYGHGSPSTLLPSIRAYSYLPMQNIMKLPDEVGCQDGTTSVKSPPSYVPRSSKLGRSSIKVFLADGFHQYDPTTRKISYFSGMQSSRGVMGPPPSNTVGPPINNRYWRDAWGSARKFSYRHGNNNRINAGFFDGHVESLWVNFNGQKDGLRCQGFRGTAVKPHLYYPSGSTVINAAGLHLNVTSGGTLLYPRPIPVGTKLQ